MRELGEEVGRDRFPTGHDDDVRWTIEVHDVPSAGITQIRFQGR